MTTMAVLLGLLVVAVPVALADQLCTARSGKCQLTGSTVCSGEYVSSLCDGAVDRKCCVPGTYSDSRCTGQGGKCQDDRGPCSGGYQAGLCGGPAGRRCCGGTSTSNTGSGSCSALQKNLACELFQSSSVIKFQAHASGIPDNAYPYNNLNDMCNGKQASRSSYKSTCACAAPGGSVCLSAALLQYLVDLKNSGTITINELAGGCHSCTSRHYSGTAVDLNRREGRNAEYKRKCEALGGYGLDEGTHFHCQIPA